MANQDYIPAGDAEFDQFQEEIYTTATAKKAGWKIPDDDLTALKTPHDDWVAAYTVAKDPDDRTRAQVRAKDDAREVYEPLLRQFIQRDLIRNSLVTNADLTSLALKRPDGTKTKVPKPTTVPDIQVTTGPGNTVKVGFRQAMQEKGVKSRGKPDGVARVRIKYKVGTPVPQSYKDCTDSVDASRSPATVSFSPDQAGQRVYFFAAWVNTTNQEGNYTPSAVSIIIPG